jgi:hypothetical protein
MPDPVSHAEDCPSGVRHEHEGGNGHGGPEKSLGCPGHAAEREEESGQNSARTRDAAERERLEARSEDPKKRGLKVGRERAEPVDDVPVQEPAARQSVGIEPFRSDVDDRVGPFAPGNEEEGNGREDGQRRSRENHGSGEEPLLHVTSDGRPCQRRQDAVARISSIAAKAASSSRSSV